MIFKNLSSLVCLVRSVRLSTERVHFNTSKLKDDPCSIWVFNDASLCHLCVIFLISLASIFPFFTSYRWLKYVGNKTFCTLIGGSCSEKNSKGTALFVTQVTITRLYWLGSAVSEVECMFVKRFVHVQHWCRMYFIACFQVIMQFAVLFFSSFPTYGGPCSSK